MLNCRCLSFLYLFFCFLCGSSHAANGINMAYTEFPPFSYTDENNDAKGSLIQSYQKLMDLTALEPQFVSLPTRRVYEFIEEGKIDMWAGIPDSNVPMHDVLMSQQPIIEIELRAYWKKGTPPIHSAENLRGKQTILISSYSYGGLYDMLVESNIDKTGFAIDHEDGFKQLYALDNAYLLAY